MECKKYVAGLEKCHFNLKISYLKKIAFEDSGVKDIPFLTKTFVGYDFIPQMYRHGS